VEGSAHREIDFIQISSRPLEDLVCILSNCKCVAIPSFDYVPGFENFRRIDHVYASPLVLLISSWDYKLELKVQN
jgi:hypothetical protein